jgi:hypothetical protein
MKRLIPLLLIVVAVITVDSCRRDNYQVVCYGNDIQPILSKSCCIPGCHDAATKSGGYVFTAYDGVIEAVVPGDAKSSPLYKMIKGAHPVMPKEGEKLTRKQVSMIKSWIDFGAKDCAATNTVTNGGSSCDTANVAYTTHVKAIMDGFCVSCHPVGNSTGIFLDSRSGVQAAITSGKLIPAIKWTGPNTMPQGGPKLSDCNISKIEQWIANGMPN